jgi:hypothetical protein
MARKTRRAKKRKSGPNRRSSAAPLRSRLNTRRKAGPQVVRRRLAVRIRRPTKSLNRSRPLRRLRTDPRIEAAVLEMNRGRSLTAASRESQLSRKQLQDYLNQRRLVKRKGKRWVTKDNRLRRLPVMTGGRVLKLTVRGYEQARLVGEHHNAVGHFVTTNDTKFIQPFKGRSVKAVNGRRYVLETDPNALHRIAAIDTPPFHEIYEITSNT